MSFAKSTFAEDKAESFAYLGFACMALGTVVFIEPAPIDAALMALLAFGLLINRLRFTALQIYPGLCMAVFALANIGSMWNPIDDIRAVWYLVVTIYLLCSLLLFCGFINRYGERGFTLLMQGYVLAGLVSGFLASAAYFHLIPGQSLLLVNDRPKGLFKDPNVYGPYLVPVAIYALACFEDRARSSANRLRWAMISLFATVAVFLSYSRACWINFGVGLLVYMGLRLSFSQSAKEFSSRMRLLIIVGAALVGVMLAVLAIPAVHQMVEIRLGARGLQDYDKLRFYTHHLAWDSVFDRPFGIGPGQAETAFQYATHSTYLRILSENGFLGGLGFFSLLGVSMVRSVYLAARVRHAFWQPLFSVVAAVLAGLVVNSAVIDTNHWRHMWFFLALPWVEPRWRNAAQTKVVRLYLDLQHAYGPAITRHG